MGKFRPNAFTLIELLVVITIIVILLALLTPALNSALYQAKLTLCGTHQNGIVNGVIQYAFDHKRNYPYKIMVHHQQWWAVPQYVRHVGNGKYYGTDTTAGDPARADGTGGYDYRPLIDEYYNFKKFWLDPLTGVVDYGYDASDWDANILAPIVMWDSWQFFVPGTAKKTPHGKGMTKIGNRFVYNETEGNRVTKRQFNILTSDLFVYSTGASTSSHTDTAGDGWGLTERQNTGVGTVVPDPVGTAWKGTTTSYRYVDSESNPWKGVHDFNFGMQDGSVRRIANIAPPSSTQPYDSDYPLKAVPPGSESNGTLGAAAARQYILEN